mgnify:CR=1 FL=1
MDIKQVKLLTELERFHYWIKERHSVYLKKQAGKLKPWTDDKIIQSYYFLSLMDVGWSLKNFRYLTTYKKNAQLTIPVKQVQTAANL